jgi:hypothetical protein
MKILDLSRYALGICAGTAILAGCNSGGSQVAPAGPMQQSRARLDLNAEAGPAKPLTTPLSGEVFSASNVTVKTTKCGGGQIQGKVATFGASGKTEGPYRGTFSAKGDWGWSSFPLGRGTWHFNESFGITSGTRTISGKVAGFSHGFGPGITCKSFGSAGRAAGLKYHSRIDGISYSGPVTVRKIAGGFLREMLR